MPQLTLDLPWPPSANTYYRRAGHVVYISEKGRRFQQEVTAAVHGQFVNAPIDDLVTVYVEAWAPNARSWDVDNRIKPLLDALTKACIWTDDKLVRKVTLEDKGIRRPCGELLVYISPFTDDREGIE